MPAPRPPEEPEEPEEPERPEEPEQPSESGERLRRNPDADPVRIHRDYVQRRIGGGALPTPEAYEQALDQWHQLGGAIRGPAQDVHPQAERATAAGETARERRAARADGDAENAGTEEFSHGPLPATDPGDDSAYNPGR